jgi:hypothetical protein
MSFFLVCFQTIPHVVSLLANFPHLQAVQIAATAQINEELYESADPIANSCRVHCPTLRRVTFRDMSCWTPESPTTGLQSFRLEDTQMVPQQLAGSGWAGSLLETISAPPEEDVPFCYETYAETWRNAFIG